MNQLNNKQNGGLITIAMGLALAACAIVIDIDGWSAVLFWGAVAIVIVSGAIQLLVARRS